VTLLGTGLWLRDVKVKCLHIFIVKKDTFGTAKIG
jgi:hypothetical protein